MPLPYVPASAVLGIRVHGGARPHIPYYGRSSSWFTLANEDACSRLQAHSAASPHGRAYMYKYGGNGVANNIQLGACEWVSIDERTCIKLTAHCARPPGNLEVLSHVTVRMPLKMAFS